MIVKSNLGRYLHTILYMRPLENTSIYISLNVLHLHLAVTFIQSDFEGDFLLNFVKRLDHIYIQGH